MPRSFLPRRRLLLAIAALPWIPALAQRPSRVLVEVWKDPNCGCCQDWVKHLEAHGFTVRVHDTGNAAMRARLGIPEPLASCHTGLVGGYALEGHVPAADVRRLLKERPDAVGLAVPGMPVGSPGMDGPAYGGHRERYDVLLVPRAGAPRVFSSHHQTRG